MNSIHFIMSCSFLLLIGCQTIPYQGKARIVKMKPQSEGVIALPLDPRQEDRDVAEEKMRSNCNPKKFKVLEEGEVVIGEKTQTKESREHRPSTERKVGSLFGIPVTSGSGPGTEGQSEEIRSQVKEWQINYKCTL